MGSIQDYIFGKRVWNSVIACRYFSDVVWKAEMWVIVLLLILIAIVIIDNEDDPSKSE